MPGITAQHPNNSEQSLDLSTAGQSTQAASVLNLGTTASHHKLRPGTDRLKFVGKHSKDRALAVYLQKRSINEYERDSKVESLLGVVRVGQLQADRILEADQGTCRCLAPINPVA